ncbi:MAG: VWA domain-containing protein [Candidatus Heimdallarchaeota archaeon]|nr:MAG: VWA domain-containing protein [Candidatus Heimdallarchaeota archaeon]
MKGNWSLIRFLTISFCVCNIFSFFLPASAGLTTPNTDTIVFEEFRLNAVIYETLAEVNASGLFYNPSNELVTGEFIIEIPTGAYLSNISLELGDYTYWGRIMKVQEAQEAFANATESNRSAVLLTQISPNLFRTEFSIETENRIRITLTYFKRIIRNKGRYDLTINLESIITQSPLSLSADFIIMSPTRSIEDITSNLGAEITYHSFHHATIKLSENSISTGSINLSYYLTGASIGTNILAYNNGTNEFFVATFSPSLNELGTDSLAKDFVFLIDVSGSMSGLKIDQAKSALLYILDELNTDDRLGVVSFSSGVTAATRELVESSNTIDMSFLKGWVAALEAGGSTDIHKALLTGLNFFESLERPMILVLLTDGRPTSGLTNPVSIQEDFSEANNMEASLFTLGFGNDVDFQFLGQLARQNSGEAFKIEENLNAEDQIKNFYDSVSTPILVDLELTIHAGVVNNVVYPYFIPNLFDGSEIFLVGEREPESEIEMTITGQSSVGELQYHIELTAPSSTDPKDAWIEKTWAIATIDDLLKRIEYGESDVNLSATVTSMALYYGIVTPYTAMFIDTLKDENFEENQVEEIYEKTVTQIYYDSPGPQPGGEQVFADRQPLGERTAVSGFIWFFGLITLLSIVGFGRLRKIPL